MVTIGPWTILDDWIAECGTEEEMSPATLARRSTWIACLSALVLDVSVPRATTVAVCAGAVRGDAGGIRGVRVGDGVEELAWLLHVGRKLEPG